MFAGGGKPKIVVLFTQEIISFMHLLLEHSIRQSKFDEEQKEMIKKKKKTSAKINVDR